MKRWLPFGFPALTILLAVFGLGICSAWDAWPAQVPPPEQNRRVVIDERDQMCISAQDCVLAWADCSSCECSTPINQQHAANVHGKLGVQSRTQAIAKARELDLLG